MFCISNSDDDDDEDDSLPRILIQVCGKTHLEHVFSKQFLSLSWLKFVYFIPCMQWVCFRDISRIVCVFGFVSSAVVSPFNTGWGSSYPNFPDWLVFWIHKLKLPRGESFAGSIIEQRWSKSGFPILKFVYLVLHLLHRVVTFTSTL